MTIPLLTTKLYVPHVRPDLVSRPRLVEWLDDGLRAGRKLTLIAAPAGFGKTTLATEWLYSKDMSVSSRSIAWLSLDEGDNDPTRFFTYLIAALRQIDAGVGQATQSLLGSPQMPPTESLATTLVNDIAAISAHFVLVLDDYQLIHNPLIHDALTFILDHQPPQMHLLIATRTDPPLSLPRLRVRGQMTEIRADDLRFTEGEAATFLNRALRLPLDAEKITTLETRTEGWIAGLQLAVLSMQSKQNVDSFVEAFSGSNRHVIDYLAEEVLAQQPEAMRDFLCQTSILDRFCAPLCDAVRKTGVDSQTILEHLERQNLFLVPLDDRREWYRYHRLFADFLRTELVPEQSAPLHLRAAHWFETHDLLPEAVNHVLVHASTTGDTDEAVRIVTLAGSRALSEGALVTLLGWLDALPDEVVRTNGWLVSFKAWCLLMTGQSEVAISYIQAAEATLEPGSSPVDRGRVLSLRCAVSDAENVLCLAPQALALIGDADPLSRTGALFILGDAQDAVGDVVGATETFREAYHLAQKHGHQVIAAVALAHLAVSVNYHGQRREALTICQRGIEQYADTRGNPLPVAGLLYVVLGELAYEANDLEGAHQYLQTGLELGQQSATTLVILYSLEALAQVQYAMGYGQEALATIQEAQTLAAQAGEFEWRGAGAAIEAHLRLRRGDMQAARRWAESIGLPLADSLDQTRKYEYTNYVRILLALERTSEAQNLLARLERVAQEDGRHRHLLTIHIQQALVEHMLRNKTKALEYLERALHLAAPEGYVRAFLDDDPAVAELLVEAKHVAPRFVDKLLAAFSVREYGSMGETPPHSHTLIPPHSDIPALIEVLSDRELEVLHLLATDLSAPEIAEELFVAVSTVRSHIKHIYGKLDAHGRYEAVERAKTLGLL
jgi:LuxR family maltose regulon positive regulatory protein